MQTLRLINADCITKMQSMSECSVDVIVTDPPYLIKYMSRSFDKQDDTFHARWTQAAFRVLKPGGRLKAFDAVRNQHRLAQAMSDSGFTSIQLEAWGYSCLSEDTEILTASGWKLGVDVSVGEQVACWDPHTEAIHLDIVQDTFLSTYTGDMVPLKNENTDQLLTPNHRVYKKSSMRHMVSGLRKHVEESVWNVQFAGDIDRRKHHYLKLPLAGYHSGSGIVGGVEYAAFLGWVWSEGGFDNTGTGVRLWQSSVNQPYVDIVEALVTKFAPGHSHYTRKRQHQSRDSERGLYTYTEHCWYFSGEPALAIRNLLPDKHPTYELIFRMTQEEKLAFMMAAVMGDGSINTGAISRRTGIPGVDRYCFYQKCEPDLVLFQTLCHLTGRQGCINLRKQVVGVHNRATTQFQDLIFKGLPKTVAYSGKIWCVTVPTGAFVARRNGQVFITGNSGFPHSKRTDLQIDKLQGRASERPILGWKQGVGGENLNDLTKDRSTVRDTSDKGGNGVGAYGTGAKQRAIMIPVTGPASADSAPWVGWGTGLKPAVEVVLVGMKPKL